jgi:hypothetical protein
MSGYQSPQSQKNPNSLASQAGTAWGKMEAQSSKLSGKTSGDQKNG